MQCRDDNSLDPYWVCNAYVDLATRTDSASDEEGPPAKKARVQGSSTSGEPLGEKARPDREAAAPKADAAKFVRNVDVVQDPEAAAAKLGGLAHKDHPPEARPPRPEARGGHGPEQTRQRDAARARADRGRAALAGTGWRG